MFFLKKKKGLEIRKRLGFLENKLEGLVNKVSYKKENCMGVKFLCK